MSNTNWFYSTNKIISDRMTSSIPLNQNTRHFHWEKRKQQLEAYAPIKWNSGKRIVGSAF